MSLVMRNLLLADYEPVTAVVNDWWGRPVAVMLQRLFFEHFQPTSFVIEDNGGLVAFLVGFISQTDPALAYIHFVGVKPEYRAAGLGRELYNKFFVTVKPRGCRAVESITSPINQGSINFHRKMGFEILPGDAEENGVSVTANYAGPGQPRVRFRRKL